MTNGYIIFYEGSSVSDAEQSIGAGSLSSLPPAVKQIFDSFVLLAPSDPSQFEEGEDSQPQDVEGVLEGGNLADQGDDGDDDQGDDGDDDQGDDGDDDQGDDGDDE
jgi:hypothetical protein